jgi:hypothetical protein
MFRKRDIEPTIDTVELGSEDVGKLVTIGGTLSADTWNETQILSGSLLPGTADIFGRAVSLRGNRCLIGANLEDPSDISNAGVAYIFDRVGTTWEETQILSGSDSLSGDHFGWSVSLDSNRCLIGVRNHDTVSGNTGAAYTFDLSGSTWVETQKLTGSLANANASGNFGWSVSLDGNRCLIGSYLHSSPGLSGLPGAAYIFDLSGSTWVETQIITGSLGSNDDTPGFGFDQFGSAVSLDGDRCLIGAFGEDPPGGAANAGVAYIFDLSGSTWVETQILTGSPIGSVDDRFGISVSLDGDRCIVGSLLEDPPGDTNAGTAHIFDLSGSTWIETQVLCGSFVPDDGVFDYFGNSVSLDGDRCAIGAPLEDLSGGNPDDGVAYIFDLIGGIWQETAVLTGSLGGGNEDDQFGWSVSLDGDRCLIGALGEDPSGVANAGVAYIFDGIPSAGQVYEYDYSTGDQIIWSNLPASDPGLGGQLFLSGDTLAISLG